MRRTAGLVAVALIMAACGTPDDEASDTVAAADNVGSSTSEMVDPCTLIDDSMRAKYLDGAGGDGEPGEAGPIDSCRWRTENANSLLIQVATDHSLYKPDPCEDCITLTFGDDGYAWDSALQSGATVVIGSNWYSVTTTGFGDTAAEVAGLLEQVVANAQ